MSAVTVGRPYITDVMTVTDDIFTPMTFMNANGILPMPYIHPVSCSWGSCGQKSKAIFEYNHSGHNRNSSILQYDDDTFRLYDDMPGWIGCPIFVALLSPNSSPEPIWSGRITATSDVGMKRTFTAHGMDNDIGHIYINAAYTNGYPLNSGYTESELIFNSSDNKTAPNMGYAEWDVDGLPRFDELKSHNLYWSNYDILYYLMYTARLGYRGDIIDVVINNGHLLHGIYDTYDLNSMSLYDALRKIIPESRGLGFTVAGIPYEFPETANVRAWDKLATGPGCAFILEINIFPLTQTLNGTTIGDISISTPYNWYSFDGSNAAVTVISNELPSNTYDTITVQGGPIYCTETYSVGGIMSNLEPGWTREQEVAYIKGDSTGIYSGDDAVDNDDFRKSEQLKDVYTRFLVKQPYFWDTPVGIGNCWPVKYINGMIGWDENRYNVIPGDVSQLPNTFGSPQALSVKRFLPDLRITPAVYGDYIVDQPEMAGYFVLLSTYHDWLRSPTNIIDKEPTWANLSGYIDMYGDQHTITIKGLKDAWGFEIKGGGINHFIALDNYLCVEGKTAWGEAIERGPTDVHPGMNFQDIHITATTTSDFVVGLNLYKTNHPLAGTRFKTLLIQMPELEAWFIAPGTFLGLTTSLDDDEITKHKHPILYGVHTPLLPYNMMVDDTPWAYAAAIMAQYYNEVSIRSCEITMTALRIGLEYGKPVVIGDGILYGGRSGVVTNIEMNFNSMSKKISTSHANLDFTSVRSSFRTHKTTDYINYGSNVHPSTIRARNTIKFFNTMIEQLLGNTPLISSNRGYREFEIFPNIPISNKRIIKFAGDNQLWAAGAGDEVWIPLEKYTSYDGIPGTDGTTTLGL